MTFHDVVVTTTTIFSSPSSTFSITFAYPSQVESDVRISLHSKSYVGMANLFLPFKEQQGLLTLCFSPISFPFFLFVC